MKNINRALVILITGLICSCQSSSKEEKQVLAKAYEKQKEVIEAIESIEENLPANLPDSERDSLHVLIEEIEESLFAIKGYDLELSGHEGHDHSHEQVNLTADEVLGVQEELLRKVNQIRASLTKED